MIFYNISWDFLRGCEWHGGSNWDNTLKGSDELT